LFMPWTAGPVCLAVMAACQAAVAASIAYTHADTRQRGT
jgi:hypothetical protein